MANIVSSDGYSNDPSTWPDWVVWPGPKRIDPRLAQAGGVDHKIPDDGTTRHTHAVRSWFETHLPRPYPWDERPAEWERRHPGIPYRSDEAAAMTPDDYPA